jgi:hypothetical protein
MQTTSHNYSRALKIFGIGTIALWLSYVIYLPPFVAWPDVKGVAKEVWESRKLKQEAYQSQNDIENRFNKSLYIAYSKVYLMTILGVGAGFLILAKRKTGRYLALLLAIIMIGSRIFAALRHSQGITGWFKMIYGFLLFQTPITVIHKDIIAPLFFIFTIMFSCNRLVTTHFTDRRLIQSSRRA